MKRVYLYTISAIIIITVAIIIQGEREGFTMNGKWYTSEYFLVPLAMSFVLAPIVYYIYNHLLRPINKTLTAKPVSSNNND